MSILFESEDGWFIDCIKYFNNIYSNCVNKNSENYKFMIRGEFFNIKTPFLMQSSAVKKVKNTLENKRKRASKKKEKCGLPSSESCCLTDILIKKTTLHLIQNVISLGYLDHSEVSGQEWFENNSVAREAAKDIPSVCFKGQTIFYDNPHDASLVTSYQTEDYLIPPQSKVFLSDVIHLSNLRDKFDLILLDPPWENKSVKRKKGYWTLNLQSLFDLPIEKLCNPGCLIVVWVTNNKKQISFVQEKLFKKWNVLSNVLWHWMKVTQKGHFIHPIDSAHKKPYENLLLGYVSSDKEEAPFKKTLKHHKIIVSVPSSIHSHKPPLVEILQPYLPEHPNCLEIFARYLLPGWTSIGNEVIKLQNIKLFVKDSAS